MNAGVAQSVEQLICNQQVAGSSPIASFGKYKGGDFPSGQRGRTVNPLRYASEVRILHPPVGEVRSRKLGVRIKLSAT